MWWILLAIMTKLAESGVVWISLSEMGW